MCLRVEGIRCLIQGDEVIRGVAGGAGFVAGDVYIVTERHKHIFKCVTADIFDVILKDKEIVERRITPLEPIDFKF